MHPPPPTHTHTPHTHTKKTCMHPKKHKIQDFWLGPLIDEILLFFLLLLLLDFNNSDGGLGSIFFSSIWMNYSSNERQRN